MLMVRNNHGIHSINIALKKDLYAASVFVSKIVKK